MADHRQFYNQCHKNYSREDLNTFIRDPQTGEEYSFARKRTLFNLYAFTPADSFLLKNSTEEMTPPKLNLRNVEVQNFLYDYDSLVNIENDNYFVRHDFLFMLGNPEAGASVTIESSTVKDSSFCFGMVNH